MYTIGKLSKETGVTKRTLDYYDEIGLVNPSSRTSGGHRLYGEEDVMRLERVLALKYMGFSLEQIKSILESSKLNWKQSIQQQLEMVKKEQERLKLLEQALLGVSYSIEFEGGVSWPIILNMIKILHQDPEEVFEQYQQYLDHEDMNKIKAVNDRMTEEDMHEWMQANYEIKKHLHLDPSSEQALQLAQRWADQAERMFESDDELLGDLWEALQNLEEEGIAFYPMDKEIIGFLKSVLAVHKGAK
ncbi:MerR family transcriptional regulator [Ornithinibacillus halotolerans]|uniref:MerR family transcriptional regulator n=1 Tax=Ornithinibacillus halotolerans TaxID=1274357 RepID=A0A916S6K5_9BACI|nr:MerR family transcriptional regulator [Ornithinibacillus halotolerans]GGA86729.1 MerR family transcriptional regulator [Ornithinibacillus halotolerans]